MRRTAVSNDVWRQLDPSAGRLSRRAAVRAWLAIAVALGLILGVNALWQSGAFVAQLRWGVFATNQTTPPSDTFGLDVEITNDGLAALTVLGVGQSVPGLDLVGADRSFPVRLDPDASLRTIITYRITDCAQAPVGSAPVAVRIQRRWGSQTANPRSYGESRWSVWTSSWCHSSK